MLNKVNHFRARLIYLERQMRMLLIESYEVEEKKHYKGVYKIGSKWKVVLTVNRQVYYLGLYDDPKDAALVYDKKAIELLGVKARLNFKEGEIKNKNLDIEYWIKIIFTHLFIKYYVDEQRYIVEDCGKYISYKHKDLLVEVRVYNKKYFSIVLVGEKDNFQELNKLELGISYLVDGLKYLPDLDDY